jgi:phage terminase large subunit GpA-like protein
MGARDFDAMQLEAITPLIAREIQRALRGGLSPLTVEPPLSLSKWAAKHFYMSAESSQKRERWVAWPFQPGIMDAMSNDAIEEVDVMKSARVGYTKMLLACIAYDAHHKKRNQAIWQPTDDDSASFTKTELEPMLRDVACMQKVFPSFLAKNKDNTLQHKKFLGSMLHMLGGKAAKNYRRITIASAKLDEIDGFDKLIERSADPFTLAWKRLEGATFKKLIAGTTPRIKGDSHIEGRDLVAQARMRYQIECPLCGLEHPLVWGGKDKAYGFKWDGHDENTVRHHCQHCRGAIVQADYLAAYGTGAWVSECGNWRYGQDGVWRDAMGMPCKPPRHVSFRLWTAYSPQVTWAEIVREFLQAMVRRKSGDKGPLQGFINETLGETWEDDDSERIEHHELSKRAEDYRLRFVPMGGLVLVAGVDVQHNRFEVVVWAIGRGEEMWVIDYNVIPANPADEREWDEKLDPYLNSTFQHASGQSMRIEGTAIDMMGDFTHQGYNFCRMRERRRVYAVRGDPLPGKPIGGRATLQDVNFRGKTIKRGVKLWYVGTDTAKDLIFGRLKVTQPGPGYVHFSKDLPESFYEQLTVEARVPVRTASGHVTRWVNVHRRRNEAIDCSVYALFVTHRLALHTFTDKMWARLESAFAPDLFSAAAAAPAADAGSPSQEEALSAQVARSVLPRGLGAGYSLAGARKARG